MFNTFSSFETECFPDPPTVKCRGADIIGGMEFRGRWSAVTESKNTF